jgi:hypothetical protein
VNERYVCKRRNELCNHFINIIDRKQVDFTLYWIQQRLLKQAKSFINKKRGNIIEELKKRALGELTKYDDDG